MNRRKFLKFLGRAGGAAVAAPVLAKIPVEEELTEAVIEKGVTDFGLAPLKKEGGIIAIDSNFGKAIWPGIEKWYNETYKSMELTKEQVAAEVFSNAFERGA
jgi:hypothetical protein